MVILPLSWGAILNSSGWSNYGDLSSCESAVFNSTTSEYDYLDGFNYTDTATYTYFVTAAGLSAEAQATLGVNLSAGDTYLLGVHWRDVTGLRAGGWFFSRPSGYYKAVFQYEDVVWTLPQLYPVTLGNNSYYTNSDNQYLWSNGSYLITPFAVTAFNDGGVCDPCMATGYLALVNATDVNVSICHDVTTCAGRVGGTALMNQHGLIWAFAGVDTNNAPCGWHPLRYDMVDKNAGDYTDLVCQQSGATNPNFTTISYNDLQSPAATGLYGDIYHLRFDYYDCPTGKVLFTAYAGSEECAICDVFSGFTCVISGESIGIPASGDSDLTGYQTEPVFTDGEFLRGDGLAWSITSYFGTHYSVGDASLQLYKYLNNPSILSEEFLPVGYYAPEHPNYQHDVQLTDSYGFDVIRYDSPTQNINDINISTLQFNTTLNTDSAVCYTDLVFGNHNYTFKYVVGLNATHYKIYNYSCLNGAATLLGPYYDTGFVSHVTPEHNALIVQNYPYGFQPQDPIYLDEKDGEWFIARTFMYDLDFKVGTRSVYTPFVIFADDDFNLTFNYSDCDWSENITGDLGYNDYDYTCTLPAGYVDVNNAGEGTATVDGPLEVVRLRLEKQRDLDAYVTIEYQNSPAPGAVCLADSGLGDTANIDGECYLSYIVPDSLMGLTVSYGEISQNFSVCVSDYYNSDGCGIGPSCGTFNGTYFYYHDLQYADTGIPVNFWVLDFTNGDEIDGAVVYWDGVEIAVTDSEGEATGFVPAVYDFHNLTVTAECHKTYIADVMLDYPGDLYTVRLVRISGCDVQADIEDITTGGGVLALLGNMRLVGVLIIILTGVAGAGSAGLPGAMLGLSGSALLLALIGLIPWLWAIPVIFLAVIVGAVGWKGIISGTRGGG